MIDIHLHHNAIVIRALNKNLSMQAGGWLVHHARCISTLMMLRDIFPTVPEISDLENPICLFQINDQADADINSVAFGRRVNEDISVGLVMDTYFYQSCGYDLIRKAASTRSLPSWKNRHHAVFWRGLPTYAHLGKYATLTEDLNAAPRVRLCEALRKTPNTDALLGGVWGDHYYGTPALAQMESELIARGLLGTKIDMIEYANYKFSIDIDGVANAWGFFEKLLLGCCILKVESIYEQWFYSDLRPYEHYIPIKSDLSNLSDQIEWCLQNDTECEAVAKAGQSVALKHTFNVATDMTRSEILAHFGEEADVGLG